MLEDGSDNIYTSVIWPCFIHSTDIPLDGYSGYMDFSCRINMIVTQISITFLSILDSFCRLQFKEQN
ncbi:hypothetical protein V1478_015623 [Vespula squamosa]|uniref:Uncharacterized protein n=1 Tax=Vespula squamosa TaxID=30214 RepID=A0ABD2A1C9_VESSQ